MLLPVILAGGCGTRLWPLSRASMPKQFTKLLSDNTMMQETLLRLSELDCAAPYIICNEEHRFIVAEQLRELGIEDATIILEPEGKNTAPAIALAALFAEQQHGDIDMLVLPSDHLIKNEKAFIEKIITAKKYAQTGKLMTLGIAPEYAETGYGYIQLGEELINSSDAYRVAKFVEKPDQNTATSYFLSKQYLWNSGMFVFSSNKYLRELKQFQPKIYQACDKATTDCRKDLCFFRIDEQEFSKCPSESIDYAVMEYTKDAAVIPLDCGWSDIGSLKALWQVTGKDCSNNVARGEVVSKDTSNSLLLSDDKLLVTLGVENLVVVNTKDAVLVTTKEHSQELKTVVESLKSQKRLEISTHKKVYRPWGQYEAIDEGERFQVKRITVKPGAKLSIQVHHHRAEHWIVVSGTAKVLNGDNEFFLTENQSTYIPLGVKHCLENPGKIPLELIEVQSGSYLGEDDIIRFEDKYGRAT